jgi:putative transposase
LLATLAEANAACDAISSIAWHAREFRRIPPLQKISYHQVKDSFRLGAQVLIRCIAKVADAYKLDRNLQRTFRPLGAIAFDDRNLSWYSDKQAVSIWTLEGRQYIPYSLGEHQRALLPYRKGESDLVYHKRAFYLLAVCDVPEPDEQQMDGVLGVDLGIVNLATDSDGEPHSGDQLDRTRQWYARRRAALQALGTKSAKRRLCVCLCDESELCRRSRARRACGRRPLRDLGRLPMFGLLSAGGSPASSRGAVLCVYRRTISCSGDTR